MVGVQHQDLVHRLLNHRIQLIRLRRDSKQHMQEIPRVGKIVARILRRLLNRKLIAHRRQRRHFRQQAGGGQRAVLGIFNVQHIVIERRQRAHQSAH